MKTTRRGFLRTLSAAAAMAPVAGFPAVVKRRSPNSLLSHACVGTGNMAWADIEGLCSHPEIHITALCDVDSEYLAAAKSKFPDARIYRHALEMFETEGASIDSVNVSTPDHSHAVYIKDALSRGLNVYAQKPLCHDLADVREIERLAASKCAVTQMGTQIAAWECDRQSAACISSGMIGEVEKVWIFSCRGGHTTAGHVWPLPESAPPPTLDWDEWLAGAPWRAYSEGAYHPGAWRLFRDFGTSWLGDMALHLLSPVWIGMNLGKTGPVSLRAEIPREPAGMMEHYWPHMSHIVWNMPGVPSTGGRPFEIEWCDGNLADRKYTIKTAPKFFPPAFARDLFARSPIGELPLQGRVVEGTEGWLLSVHYGVSPCVIDKRTGAVRPPPEVGAAPSHWHEYVNACIAETPTTSAFEWAGRLTEMVLTGNAAMSRPGELLVWNAEKGSFA